LPFSLAEGNYVSFAILVILRKSIDENQLNNILNSYLDAVAVEGEARFRLTEQIKLVTDRETCPKWSTRTKCVQLANLTAPAFLKMVHRHRLGQNFVVDTMAIRAIDPALMDAVTAYTSQRKRRNLGLGDAVDLVFRKSRLRKVGKKRKKWYMAKNKQQIIEHLRRRSRQSAKVACTRVG
jgi:hypothetical protein